MNAKRNIMTAVAGMWVAGTALAGEATTSATAASNGWGPGTAAATADYTGSGVGYTNTKAESGDVSWSRGLAYGMDEDGFDLSLSYAVAPNIGPAVGATFNVGIGLDGVGSSSVGRVVASGDPVRRVTAGGFTGRTSQGGRISGATAEGHAGPRGAVRVFTKSDSRGPSNHHGPRAVYRMVGRQ